MMLPVNVLLIVIFTSIRPRYARNLYHVHLDTLKMHMALRAIKDDEFADLQHAQHDSLVSLQDRDFFVRQPVPLNRLSLRVSIMSQDFNELKVPSTEKGIKEFAKRTKEKMKSAASFQCRLPWWCVYFNWVRQSSCDNLSLLSN
jgi:hypothetical protein